METASKVLLVDDEVNVLKALRRLLMDENYELLTATSGDEGLAVLREHPDVRVVISDYRMPGMNGVEFLRHVCRDWPETVRIVLSGFADTPAVVDAINEGKISKFLCKPWEEGQIKAVLDEVTGVNVAKDEPAARLEDIQIVDERAQGILDALPFEAISVFLDGRILFCNQMAQKSFGLSEPRPSGQKLTEWFEDSFCKALLDGLQQGGTYHGEVFLSDRWYQVKANLVNPGQTEEVLVVFEGVDHGE